MNANIKASICFNFIFMVFVIGLISSHAIAQTDSTTTTQYTERVTISVDSATYEPLTDVPGTNQLKVIVAYSTIDPQLVNTKINGVMEVLAEDGTLVKTSSFPDGLILTESGRIQFASSFTDPTMHTATANIVLMDLEKTEVISNAVSTTVSLGDVRYGNDSDILFEESNSENITVNSSTSSNTTNATIENGTSSLPDNTNATIENGTSSLPDNTNSTNDKKPVPQSPAGIDDHV